MWLPLAGSVALSFCGGRAHKGTVASASTSACEEICPSAIALMLVNSVPPHMSPVLQLRGSESSELICGPFKGNCLGIQQFLFPEPQHPLFFTTRSYEELSSWCWNPGLWCLVWGWDPLLQYIPPNLYAPQWEQVQPIPCVCLS
ncbi:hypothetical protein HJG60_010173 [Phyllostomus discolor]|uniref:Uncharacterized protein n=1 Tax=Phyllostomus discolor TaxID=89673 RepID=A0A834AXU6_9CHIR|nr:hypothetical protein HJG60_010173 [Phyllostomus discolor]